MSNIKISKNHVNIEQLKSLEFEESCNLKYFIESSEDKSTPVNSNNIVKISMVGFDKNGTRMQ